MDYKLKQTKVSHFQSWIASFELNCAIDES